MLHRSVGEVLERPLHVGKEAICVGAVHDARSEEHTSELQSRSDLVCRLLLEKKKKNHNRNIIWQPLTKQTRVQRTVDYSQHTLKEELYNIHRRKRRTPTPHLMQDHPIARHK